MDKQFFELTNPQKSIWYTEKFFENAPINNICGVLKINQKVDFSILEKALNLFVKNNDSFRIQVKLENNLPFQYIQPFQTFKVPLDVIDNDENLKNVEKNFSQEIFSLINCQLFKFKMFKLKDGTGGFMALMHHLISDAWSSGLLINEVMDIYASLINNVPININFYSYIDYIESEKEYLLSEKYKNDEDYWLNQFSSIPEIATIPSPKANPNKSNTAKRLTYCIDKLLINNINSFCLTNKISIFNFFMGILATYIGKLCNLQEFVIGTPILNRSSFKEKHTTGMFISTVPFKISLTPTNTFLDFVSKIAKDTMSMLRHQKYPYQKLLEILRKSNPDLPNLYNIAFSYQNTRSNKNSSSIDFESYWIPNDCIGNNIEFHIHDLNDSGSLNISYDYKDKIYTSYEISMIHKRILCIIQQVLDNGNIQIKDINIVTPEEEKQLLVDFSGKKTNYPKNSTIVSLFEQNVENFPNSIAVSYKNENLTYQELNNKVNQFANYLLEQKISGGNVISICMEKNINFIIAILAVQKIGCAYLPINPTYPFDRIKYIMENSNSILLIADHCINIKNTLIMQSINLSNYSPQNPNINISCKDLAYVIYTSGSTGDPKGVMVNHRNLINFIYCLNNQFKNGLIPADNCLSLANISFDASVFEIFSPLVMGCKLVLYPENILTDITLLCDTIFEKNITFLYIPPNILLDVCSHLKSLNKPIPINKLFVGVESIKNGTLNNYLELNSSMEIVNAYGPTETSIVATFFPYIKNENIENVVPIGFPVDNSHIYIVNSYYSLQPIHAPGEIYVCGDNVSKGYLNNVDLTKKSFIPNFLGAGQVAYKTGDLGYWNLDGSVQFIGRNDSQIKFRGHRIELGEINNTIKAFPKVKNSFTTIVSVNNIPALCSYVVAEKKQVELLKEHLKNTLPYYMIPTHIIPLEKMPVNLNGKIDKTKLPSIAIIKTEMTSAKNKTEEILLKIWQSILGLEEISTNSDFFELGADSLCSIKLISEIYEKLNIKIPIKVIFEHRTIISLAQYIDEESEKIVHNTITPVKKASYYKTSAAQKRIYYASQLAGEKTLSYNISGGIILDSTLNVCKLQNCINKLVKRHISLRTYFEIVNNEIVQKIDDTLNINVETINCKESQLEEVFKNFAKAFDLSKAPLARFMYVNFENGKSAFLINTHHIISDGSSISLLINELCQLYNDIELTEHKIHYIDFANWENEQLKTNSYEKHKQFWKSNFEDEIPVLNLPTQFSRPNVSSFQGKKVHSSIGHDLTASLYQLANQLSVTPYMLFLSVYYILLAKYSSQEDIIVGSPIVGRELPETYSMMGMFVNSLPLRNNVNQELSFHTFLQQVKKNCLACFEHQAYPFDELVNQLNLNRDISRNPLFDTMFVFQNEGNPKIGFGDVKAKYYIPDMNISKFDLTLEIMPDNDHLNLSFEYCTDLFENWFIENMANHYTNILKIILDNPNIVIKDIDILSSEEKYKLIYEFNNTSASYSKDKTISQLFEAQVEKTPDSIAVVFENQKLTYKQLNEKANCLAHYIVGHGINKSSIVGIMLSRSLELVITILAANKLGSAYILIDPTLPNERIQYMLENSKASLLITNKKNNNIHFANIMLIDELNIKPEKNLNIAQNNNEILCIIYTSGSTGMPKGVLLRKIGFVNLLYAFNKCMDIFNFTNFLSIATVSFDMFSVELFCSLLQGKKLFLTTEEEQRNPRLLAEIIENNHIEFMVSTPSKVELFLSNEYFAKSLKFLKAIQLGGEVFSPSLFKKLKKYTQAKLYNGYGPTEITACCSNKEVLIENNINIGKPINNTKIFILDKYLKLCPVGVPGEICVTGDGISGGYINQPDATKKNFVKNPFDNNIIYKTGDIGTYSKDFEIQYIGRNDHQVKLHGLRIELSEIEKQIISIPSVSRCVVLLNNFENTTHIVSFYTGTADSQTIKTKLEKILPAYMVPKYFIHLKELPMNSNGKIDVIQLKKMPIHITTNYVPPENEIQKLFCQILEKLLNTKVGIDDDIFELGLDSLLAIQFKIELMAHNINIFYNDIFKNKTVRKLSSLNSNNIETTSLQNLQYSTCNKLLKKNKLPLPEPLNRSTHNNILLLGSNGFVGMHILHSFIINDTGKIYCIVRDKNGINYEQRFLNTLHFYFGNTLDTLINNRIFIIRGSILEDNFGLDLNTYNEIINNVDIVINSAARVKHYGDANVFKVINIGSTKKTIDFCKANNKKMLHISSLSISGNVLEYNKNSQNNFSEQNLYIGQTLENIYIKTKFEAEKLILDNISNGLHAQILRLGNITSRYSDGKFQINPSENAFANRIKAFIYLKNIPDYLATHSIEFTPVDQCSNAIIKIMQNNISNYSVFHLYNPNFVKVVDLIKFLKSASLPIEIVNKQVFDFNVGNLLAEEKHRLSLSGIINDFNQNNDLVYHSNVKILSSFTEKFLELLDFNWNIIDELYIQKYINYLKSIKFI